MTEVFLLFAQQVDEPRTELLTLSHGGSPPTPKPFGSRIYRTRDVLRRRGLEAGQHGALPRRVLVVKRGPITRGRPLTADVVLEDFRRGLGLIH